MSIDISLLGQRIQKARNEKEMELSALASRVGITQESLRHIEHGIRKHSLNTLFSLANELNVSLDYLTGRADLPSDLFYSGLIENSAATPLQKKLIVEILGKIALLLINVCNVGDKNKH